MKIVLILFIGGINYAIPTSAAAAPATVVFDILNGIVDNELYLKMPYAFNTTHRDCVWRDAFKDRKLCTDEVKIWLNSNGYEEMIDPTNPNWLRESKIWDKTKENTIFVHGYTAGDSSPMTLFIRDAFRESGTTNFFWIDYGPVSRAPCYIQLVQNIKYVSYCLSLYLKDFLQNGMPVNNITCIGHSMGAHICGLLKRYLRLRIKKIIGLDPALPMITDSVRLSWRDAKLVHTFQTNAGYYGEIGAIGHLDICVNNGLTQPFCANNNELANLCSHIYALCFMAHSLFNQNHELKAQPCTEACPHLGVFQITKDFLPHHQIWSQRSGNHSVIGSTDSVSLGMNIPKSARGSYCLTAVDRPFCPSHQNRIGTKRCCSIDEFLDSNDDKPIERYKSNQQHHS